MAQRHLNDMVVVLSDGDTFTSIDGTIIMQLLPGDARKLADNDVVNPVNIYDLTDPVDLRRLAALIESEVQ